MPKWRGMWRQDMTVTELVDLFKNEPMQFAPGERWRYNNSGYILLGAIIEKASGKKLRRLRAGADLHAAWHGQHAVRRTEQ